MKPAARNDNDQSRLERDGRDAALVERIHEGDREAFTELYLEHFDNVYAYLLVLLRDHHEAEDLAQQVFVQAFGALDRFRPQGPPFRAWLFTIARNCAISHLRKGSQTEPLEPYHLEVEAGRSSSEMPLPSEGWLTDSDLLSLVARLPVSQRQVLVLRYMLDLSQAEVAQVLDLSRENVRVLQHRALRFLEQRLAPVRGVQHRNRKAPARRWGREAAILRRRRYALL